MFKKFFAFSLMVFWFFSAYFTAWAADLADIANETASWGLVSTAKLQNGTVGTFVYFAIGIVVLMLIATVVLAVLKMAKKWASSSNWRHR
jgi:hypothetical protein